MRCFVIGNGSSLKDTPLERLSGFDTFAVNRIHLLYPDTTWRPKYYVRTEPPAGSDPEQFFEECRIHVRSGEQCIFPEGWREELGQADNIEYIPVCRHFKYPPPHKKAHMHWHLPLVCDTSVITAAMQVAFLKGRYSEIVLVGCDLEGAHFSEEDLGIIQTEAWRIQHQIAKESCPIPIYNATLGGSLDVYPRKNIFELIPTGLLRL